MTSSRHRDRLRPPARGRKAREIRKRILVLTEGSVSEKEYLEWFIDWCRNGLVEVRFGPNQATPKTLVDEAVATIREARRNARRERDSHLAFDEVWCAYDVDEHPFLAEARDKALANDVRLAVSNPCFEVWLLLHLREPTGCMNRQEMQKAFRTQCGSNFLGKHLPLTISWGDNYESALQRARRLHDERVKPWPHESDANPCTTVHLLTESIRQGAR